MKQGIVIAEQALQGQPAAQVAEEADVQAPVIEPAVA